jgi:protocadherin Fat 1/2/3
VIGPVDPARDIETLNEDIESEYVDDSECDQSEKPLSLGLGQSISIQNLNPLDSGSEDYRFNTGECFPFFTIGNLKLHVFLPFFRMRAHFSAFKS